MNGQDVDHAGVTDLLKQALDDARELMKIEVELAKDDLKEEVRSGVRAAIGFCVAAMAVVVAVSLLAVALVLVLGGTPLAASFVAVGFLIVGGVAFVLGYGALPKNPITTSVERIEKDAQHLKEHAA